MWPPLRLHTVSPENKPPGAWEPVCPLVSRAWRDGHARHVVGTVHKLWPWAWGGTRSTQVQPGQTEAPGHVPTR